MSDWWGTKVRQFATHLGASVTPAERRALAEWLTPEQARLFDSMHRADQRHGLAVANDLRAAGWIDRDLLLAALFHDSGKGRTGVWPRVVWALGARYRWVPRKVSRALPLLGPALCRLDRHPEASAARAREAGCSERTANLILRQARPVDDEGRALHLADERN